MSFDSRKFFQVADGINGHAVEFFNTLSSRTAGGHKGLGKM
jgi:hypothetical protein